MMLPSLAKTRTVTRYIFFSVGFLAIAKIARSYHSALPFRLLCSPHQKHDRDKRASSHPLCGTWNRTATYVNGEIMNTTPAYTVITEKTYYSIAPACYNTLTIDSFHDNSFTMTMVSHNCQTIGVMAPGTVIQQTFTLSNRGNTLVIINTEYGAEVKTVFERLK